MNHQTATTLKTDRIFAIDFFRGITMFLLIGESTHLYHYMVAPSLDGTIISAIGTQLHHHPWNGLRFWDLIQPFFMFIVGVSMPFSFGKRWQRGDSWNLTFRHALKRSFLLLFFGWALYCIGPGKLTFELWNVLAQLSFTYLVAFLLMRKSIPTQIIVTFLLLIGSELLYRLFWVSGFDQPFTPDQNFGSWVDLQLMGKLSDGHWVAFNAVPTAAHTMWGILAGTILKSSRTNRKKIQILLLAGVIGIIIGYALNPVTPIIKRICTSSFVLVSGGWSFIALALSFWIIDVVGFKKVPVFFAIVGMNPLFIYLLTNTGGSGWLWEIVKPFSFGIFSWMREVPTEIITASIVWFLLWYICYFLYKRKIFIRI